MISMHESGVDVPIHFQIVFHEKVALTCCIVYGRRAIPYPHFITLHIELSGWSGIPYADIAFRCDGHLHGRSPR